ncbi:MAG: AAA family ATPase, partial [Lachnospiraceae bacterium]|nr:AAA family ATPase [Lachnospiraceae bacterium]
MKRFNVTGVCIPDKHYMVDLLEKVNTIVDEYICQGAYFTMNRARQFGKTTIINALEKRLCSEYIVISISLESADDYFVNMQVFVNGLVIDIAEELRRNGVHENIVSEWEQKIESDYPLKMFGRKISLLCTQTNQKVILIMDEADKSSDNQIFLSFLGMLRDKYLKREMGRDSTFHNVILSGVYDIKNLKSKMRPDEEKKYNSPWNIAVDFHVDMSFSAEDIAGMLREYEADHHTGMDIDHMSRLIY